MSIIRGMVAGAKEAEVLEGQRSALRRQMAELSKQMDALNSEMHKIGRGEVA